MLSIAEFPYRFVVPQESPQATILFDVATLFPNSPGFIFIIQRGSGQGITTEIAVTTDLPTGSQNRTSIGASGIPSTCQGHRLQIELTRNTAFGGDTITEGTIAVFGSTE